jgi:UDP-N-acetyl-L-fucosamine synthase
MKNSKLKVLTVVGTRPEIIRLSRTIALLDQHVNHILVHTGQNYDYELNEIFFGELEIRKPDYFLEIDTTSLGTAVGDIICKSEEVLKKEKPDALLVLGDTNSCLSAYMAKRMHIPIFHMEAGNRSFDFNVPEEINRRIIDHIADFNLVYTEHARRHLLSEGLPHRRIYLTGSPMKEVLDYYRPKIEASKVLEAVGQLDGWTVGSQQSAVSSQQYFLVSIHREENVDTPENLQKILSILSLLADTYKLPVIVSTHPRTRKRLEAVGQLDSWTVGPEKSAVGGQQSAAPQSPGLQVPLSPSHRLLHFLKPFGFIDYIHLQQHAKCVISDSGTISEESAILGFPAISLRQSMERPEAQDAGTIILTGFDPEVVKQSIDLVISEFEGNRNRKIPEEYQVTDTSWRVLKLIMGNAQLSNKWWGIK